MRARSPACQRRCTSAASWRALCRRSWARARSLRARCQSHQAWRTWAASCHCAARCWLCTCCHWASPRAALRARSPGSHRGAARPTSTSRWPCWLPGRSVRVCSCSAGGSAVQRCAVRRVASAACWRKGWAWASGWRCQAWSNKARSDHAAGSGTGVWGAWAWAAMLASAQPRARAALRRHGRKKRVCIRCVLCGTRPGFIHRQGCMRAGLPRALPGIHGAALPRLAAAAQACTRDHREESRTACALCPATRREPVRIRRQGASWGVRDGGSAAPEAGLPPAAADARTAPGAQTPPRAQTAPCHCRGRCGSPGRQQPG